jgi:hypothetical protein
LLTRIKLAGYSLLLSWTLNTIAEWVGRLIWGSGDTLPDLALYTAPVYLLTYIMFVIPLVGCCRAAWQLCFWYILLLASLAWAILAIVFIFHPSLKDFLGPWPPQGFLIWFSECAVLSITIYLLLLRSAVRRIGSTSQGADPPALYP